MKHHEGDTRTRENLIETAKYDREVSHKRYEQLREAEEQIRGLTTTLSQATQRESLMFDNLTATQLRCNELLEETRARKRTEIEQMLMINAQLRTIARLEGELADAMKELARYRSVVNNLDCG